MMRVCEYSRQEMRIISHFGFADIAGRIYPARLFEMCAVKAFMDADEGSAASALRGCIRMMETSTRGPEMDSLIEGIMGPIDPLDRYVFKD